MKSFLEFLKEQGQKCQYQQEVSMLKPYTVEIGKVLVIFWEKPKSLIAAYLEEGKQKGPIKLGGEYAARQNPANISTKLSAIFMFFEVQSSYLH